MFFLAKVARQCWEGSRSPRHGASSCLLHQKEMGANAGSPHPFSVFRFASKHNPVEKSSLLRKKISPVSSFEDIWCVSRRELYVSARRHSRGFCSRGPRDLGGAGAAAAGGEGSGDWRKAHAALPASSFCKKSLARPTNTRLTFFFRIHFGMVRAEVCASSTSR